MKKIIQAGLLVSGLASSLVAAQTTDTIKNASVKVTKDSDIELRFTSPFANPVINVQDESVKQNFTVSLENADQDKYLVTLISQRRLKDCRLKILRPLRTLMLRVTPSEKGTAESAVREIKYDPCFNGGIVPPKNKVPKAPTNLKATNITKTSAFLTWKDNSSNETSYIVIDNGRLAVRLPKNTTSYTLKGLKSNSFHIIRVFALRDKITSSRGTNTRFRTKKSSVGGNTKPSEIIKPFNGSTISPTTTFTWSKDAGVQRNFVIVKDLVTNKVLKSRFVKTTSITISNMPPAHKIRFTLYSQIKGRYTRKVTSYLVGK